MGTKRKIGMVEDIEDRSKDGKKGLNGAQTETQTTKTMAETEGNDGARLLANLGGKETSTSASETELARINERPWSEENQKV
jgi:hypothetical protein